MAQRNFDPRRLDVAAFAKEGATLSGSWPVAALPRLAESAAARDTLGQVTFEARGERREEAGGAPQTWLHLKASARLPLACQRCLEPVDVPLDVQQSLRFVAGENQAAELDADSEYDVLALTKSLDLQELVEDELLLALPLVPRHDVCPHPLPMAEHGATAEEREHPFAALAALRGGKAR
ncbi:MAG: DUF177 domain-containing protein [Proteobacteria bacterium]|nr:DUF177 domain-containing protein [Pseudomonadota bacterium]